MQRIVSVRGTRLQTETMQCKRGLRRAQRATSGENPRCNPASTSNVSPVT